jgi:hypothetical protein
MKQLELLLNKKWNIPNVRSMELGSKQGYNKFLELYGIKKVVRDGTPEFTPAGNGRLCRYVKRQQFRLQRLAERRTAPRLQL